MMKYYFLLAIDMLIIAGMCNGGEIECNNPNEFYQCGIACQTTCDTLGQICPIQNIRCNDLCYCIAGYARNRTGSCIPIKDCPQKDRCKKPNEHFDCRSAGETTCETLGEPCNNENVTCNQGCYCNDNFARDENGRCIPIEDCPPEDSCLKCTKPHEHLACGSACQTMCQTIGKPCPIINKKCTEQCYCDCGYARDENYNCIPIKNCPEPFECNDGPNEEVGCGPYDRKCATLNEPRLEEKKCYPGCYCKPGYARDEYKQCVHISDCKQSNQSSE